MLCCLTGLQSRSLLALLSLAQVGYFMSIANAADIRPGPELVLTEIFSFAMEPLFTAELGVDSCELTLTGEIVSGDAARLGAEIEKARRIKRQIQAQKRKEAKKRGKAWMLPGRSLLDDERVHLCLDSPGGNFNEGVDLAKVIERNGVVTVVGKNAKCHSACALAFLGGRDTNYRNSSGRHGRFLHIRGSLGFHAPFLPPNSGAGSGQLSGEVLRKFYSGGILSAAQLIEMLQLRGDEVVPPLRPSLVKHMLSTASDKLYLIDTIDKAGRYGIRVFGHRAMSVDARQLRRNHEYTLGQNREADSMMRFCVNQVSWLLDKPAAIRSKPTMRILTGPRADEIKNDFSDTTEGDSEGASVFEVVAYVSTQARADICKILLRSIDRDYGLAIKIESVSVGLNWSTGELWKAQPHDMRLDQLPAK